MPEEFESVYRVVGFGDNAKRMALYDLPRDDTVWVNTVGYGEELNEVLEQIETGNVISAAVTDAGDENEYWNLLDIEIEDDDILYYVETDGYTPGPTDEIWEEREPGSTNISAGRGDDDGNYLFEMQIQDETVQVDGDLISVYDSLRTGDLLTEPLFEGEGCDYLDSAKAVIVVNPETTEYVSFYIFPDKENKFQEIWGALYDYVT